MEVYKVVEKRTRHCSNWAIFKSNKQVWRHLEWRKFRKKHIEYFPRYFKGTTVKAVKGSVGILTFSGLQSAKNFVAMYPAADLKIIKVEGIGDYRSVLHLKGCCGDKPENLIYGNELEMIAPFGSLTFESVEVME